jgi:hypothetical protein
MKKGFYPVVFGLIILCVVMVSGITYYKLQESMKEGWKLPDTNYDTTYTGGLGWSRGYGDWNGRTIKEGRSVEGMVSGSEAGNSTTPSSGEGNLNYKLGDTDISGTWKSPGWSVLWDGDEEGGNGIDQIFHKTSFEGEYDADTYPPFDIDTINRLGGGWKLDHIYPDEKGGNSLIPPSGPVDDSYGKINGDLTFYAPGTFTYGSDNYVPSYAASVLLSPMLGVNAPVKPLVGEGQGGSLVSKSSVCSPGSGASVLDKESYCQKLSPIDAAGRECCVVLGGELPMAGNDQGPYNQTIYTNPVVSGGKDYYIYMGKCYGNCPPSYTKLMY